MVDHSTPEVEPDMIYPVLSNSGQMIAIEARDHTACPLADLFQAQA